MSISWGTQYTKLKTNLRLGINRLKLMEKKKTEMALKARTEIVDFITAQKPDRARIRVEHIIREDFMVEAFELIEMYCDLLLARFGLIEQMKTLDDGIAEAVISILWAAPRIAQDITEFKTISEQLTVKYGKPMAEAARADQLEYPAKVNPKLKHKLSITAPPRLLVEKYMIHIAASAGVPFTPDADVMREDEVAVAEQMLIDFKKQQDFGIGGPGEGYGWSGGHGGPPPPPFQPPPAPPNNFPPQPPTNYPPGPPPSNYPPGPPPSNYPPPPPPNDYRGGGGGGFVDDNIYEVPSGMRRQDSDPLYDEVSNQTPIKPGALPPFGMVKLPIIGPDGRPVNGPAAPSAPPQYPHLTPRNSIVADEKKAPQAPIAPIEKDDLAALFPEPPSALPGNSGKGGNGGGNSGGGGGGTANLDLDDLARRFDALKKMD